MYMLDYDETNDKSYAQDAYIVFEKAESYDPDYVDIRLLKDDAYDKGTIVIVIDVDVPFDFSLERDIEREFSDLEREGGLFQEVYYERRVDDVDCYLEIDFAPLDRFISANRRLDNYSEQVEDGFNTVIDTSGNSTQVPRFIDVTGSVTTITETITLGLRLAVTVDGNKNCTYRNANYQEQEIVETERYEWSGDRRAIPSRFLDANQVQDTRRLEEDAVEEIIEDLYRSVKNYYF